MVVSPFFKAGNSTLNDPNSGIQTPSLVFSRSRAFHLGTIDHTQEFATRVSSSGFGDQMPPPNPSVNRATDSDASVMGTFPQVLSDQDPHRDTSVNRGLASIPLAARAPHSAPQCTRAPPSDTLSGTDSSRGRQERPYGITKVETPKQNGKKVSFKEFNICRKASM